MENEKRIDKKRYQFSQRLLDQYDDARLALIGSGADLGKILLKPKRQEGEE